MEGFTSYIDFCECMDIPYDYVNKAFDDSANADESKDSDA